MEEATWLGPDGPRKEAQPSSASQQNVRASILIPSRDWVLEGKKHWNRALSSSGEVSLLWHLNWLFSWPLLLLFEELDQRS